MYQFLFIFSFSLFTILPAFAQHQELNGKGLMYKGKIVVASDSTSILSAFKKGSVNGHFRYFWMHTDNRKGLTDYYANAAGGGLRYETAKFHGFQLAIVGSIFSTSDLRILARLILLRGKEIDMKLPFSTWKIFKIETIFPGWKNCI